MSPSVDPVPCWCQGCEVHISMSVFAVSLRSQGWHPSSKISTHSSGPFSKWRRERGSGQPPSPCMFPFRLSGHSTLWPLQDVLTASLPLVYLWQKKLDEDDHLKSYGPSLRVGWGRNFSDTFSIPGKTKPNQTKVLPTRKKRKQSWWKCNGQGLPHVPLFFPKVSLMSRLGYSAISTILD